ncbi:uncharacterized protein LOC117178705 [Belonocnema kinseyi]|uniref:uncharacterized protein LOC117178705 n=1 Tax=Belonocnema kinseyi TaxID=2817044 RepID=UPI00143D3B1E|nr:uncharacterized protein LOC117178705 [Belonocnema kinseyi]
MSSCARLLIYNEKVIDDAYPLPNETDVLDHLEKIETYPVDRSKTVCSTHLGYLEYYWKPVGINKAYGSLQGQMEQVLKGLHGTEAVIYYDDTVIYSETFDEDDVETNEYSTDFEGPT